MYYCIVKIFTKSRRPAKNLAGNNAGAARITEANKLI